jgi:peptide/nickel transport system permease protein
MVGISLPEFVTGVLLMVIFSSQLGWLPTTSAIPRGESPLTSPEILVLPTLTLTGVVFAYIMRMTRANVNEVMESPYVRTAILKGLPMRKVIFRHVVPNAMLPTISIVATMTGWLLAGLIIVENVFAYPGLGQLLLSSIQTRDVPLLQALSLLIAVTYTVSTLLADLSYAVLDPRIRYA